MKKKLYACLFVLFILLAGIAGYKVISDQLDYRNATDYYNSLSDTWVQLNPQASAAPAAEEAAGSGFLLDLLAPPARAEAEEELIPDADGAEAAPAEEEQLIVPDETGEETEEGAEETPEEAGEDEIVWARFTEEQPPITVDFDGLRGENPEIVAWIYSEGTTINYPVLHTTDNEKYLTIQPDGTESRNGSIFMDYICDADFSGFNTLVYGHNRKDVMFSSLLNYGSQEYYEAHPVLWWLAPGAAYRIDVFAGMIVYPSSDVYLTEFADDEARQKFIDDCIASSDFKASVRPGPEDKLITLSTCNNTYNGFRYVVLGVLSRCGQPAD